MRTSLAPCPGQHQSLPGACGKSRRPRRSAEPRRTPGKRPTRRARPRRRPRVRASRGCDATVAQPEQTLQKRMPRFGLSLQQTEGAAAKASVRRLVTAPERAPYLRGYAKCPAPPPPCPAHWKQPHKRCGCLSHAALRCDADPEPCKGKASTRSDFPASSAASPLACAGAAAWSLRRFFATRTPLRITFALSESSMRLILPQV